MPRPKMMTTRVQKTFYLTREECELVQKAWEVSRYKTLNDFVRAALRIHAETVIEWEGGEV